jgi:hypothetical protein
MILSYCIGVDHMFDVFFLGCGLLAALVITSNFLAVEHVITRLYHSVFPLTCIYLCLCCMDAQHHSNAH